MFCRQHDDGKWDERLPSDDVGRSAASCDPG